MKRTALPYALFAGALLAVGATPGAQASGERGGGNWPTSCADAIGIVSKGLSETAKGQLRETPRERLWDLENTFGHQVRAAFGIGRGNTMLIRSCAKRRNGAVLDASQASMVIVEAVWDTVQ